MTGPARPPSRSRRLCRRSGGLFAPARGAGANRGRGDVTATVFRRVYEAPGGRRFGLLTAPAVRVVEDPEVIRDPVASLDADRVLELATDRTTGSVDGYEKAGSRITSGSLTT